MVLNVLALAVQLLLMGWLLRVLGLHRALWVLPVLLFLGAAGMVFGGGLVAALLLKGADGTLRHSLHRTSTELLFVPLPDGLRARAKPLIDVLGPARRPGPGLAADPVRGSGWAAATSFLAVAAAALCVVWIAWASDLKGHYLELFRAALREGMLRARARTCPSSTSARWRRSSPRSTARTTPRWWAPWTCWRRRAAAT